MRRELGLNTLLIVVPATFLLATLTYHVIEKPFMQLRTISIGEAVRIGSRTITGRLIAGFVAERWSITMALGINALPEGERELQWWAILLTSVVGVPVLIGLNAMNVSSFVYSGTGTVAMPGSTTPVKATTCTSISRRAKSPAPARGQGRIAMISWGARHTSLVPRPFLVPAFATANTLGAVVAIGRLSGAIAVPGYAPTMLAILFFGSLNLLALGIMGSYVWRAYENTKERPLAVVMREDRFGSAP